MSESSGPIGEVPPALGRRIDAVCDRFEAAWRSGTEPQLEDFLVGWEGAERAALLHELLALDADYRKARAQSAEASTRTDPPPLRGSVPVEVTTSVGRCIGDYELLKEIGRGGMGVVFRARQISLGRPVAVKVVLAAAVAGADELRRFQREAEILARLEHPHIIPIYETGTHQGHPYFSMPLMEGRSLAGPAGRLADNPRAAVEIVVAIAGAVQHAHSQGVLHRDLKPANVLLDASGRPQVADFGLAKLLDGDTGGTPSGAIVGTPGYMAPEQARGEKVLTPAADIYGLGAILYELLTGRPPFRAATPLETVLLVLDKEPDPPRTLNPKIDRGLEAVCLMCLEKDPARRYLSAEALTDDLGRWLRGEPVRAKRTGPGERLVRWVRRRSAVVALFLLAALASVAALFAVDLAEKQEAEKANRIEQRQRPTTSRSSTRWRHPGAGVERQSRGQETARLLPTGVPRAGMVLPQRVMARSEDPARCLTQDL